MVQQLPQDLVPLPTAPYDVRPTSLPLDRDECRTALWMARGNITVAADILKTDSGRLRKFVKNSPFLSAELAEASEQIKDTAESVVYEALTDESDKARKDGMAKFVLTNIGRDRGYGQAGKSGGVNLKLPQGNFTITWADGSGIVGNDNSQSYDDSVTIEGEVVND